MVVDIDSRTVRFFGGGQIQSRPYLRRPLLAALRALWMGWRIDWAEFGIADLAISLGWDVDCVLNSESDDYHRLMSEGMLVTPADIRVGGQLKNAESVFTVRWSDGDVRDFPLTCRVGMLSRQMLSALSLGPELLSVLMDSPSSTMPREDDPDLQYEGAFIDTGTHSIWIAEHGELDPRHIALVERRWPGWRVFGHSDGIVRQVELSGRDPMPYMVPEQQALDELVHELEHEPTVDIAGLHAALVTRIDTMQPNRSGITFGNGFFSADGPSLAPDERGRLLLRLLLDTSTSDSHDNQA